MHSTLNYAHFKSMLKPVSDDKTVVMTGFIAALYY